MIGATRSKTLRRLKLYKLRHIAYLTISCLNCYYILYNQTILGELKYITLSLPKSPLVASMRTINTLYYFPFT